MFCFKHSPCRNAIACVFFKLKYHKTRFGGLLCLHWEAARKVQNMEKKLILVTPGGIKFIWTSSAPTHFPRQLQLQARILRLSQPKLWKIAFIFTLIQFFNKLIFKKRQFSKIVTKLVYISELLSTFFVIFLAFALYFCGKN